jgi:hypothetical protein
VRHRSAEAHADLLVIWARARMVEARSKLWNALRSMAKSMGTRLPRKMQAGHAAENPKTAHESTARSGFSISP